MIELIHQRQRGQSRQDYSKRPGKLQHWISVHHAGAPNHQPCRNRRFAHGLKEQSLKPHFWLINRGARQRPTNRGLYVPSKRS